MKVISKQEKDLAYACTTIEITFKITQGVKRYPIQRIIEIFLKEEAGTPIKDCLLLFICVVVELP
jgi:predicted PP-loop superfamily ATPase